MLESLAALSSFLAHSSHPAHEFHLLTTTVVQEALDLVSTGRTVVIIAHRLSTIKRVENIVVMEVRRDENDFVRGKGGGGGRGKA